jgi:hypothetical protein
MVTGAKYAWNIEPQNAAASLILFALFIYLFFRHAMFVLMFMDFILAWLRQFRWFPGPGKRQKTIVHWLIAVFLFGGFLALSGALGWVDFVPVNHA